MKHMSAVNKPTTNIHFIVLNDSTAKQLPRERSANNATQTRIIINGVRFVGIVRTGGKYLDETK